MKKIKPIEMQSPCLRGKPELIQLSYTINDIIEALSFLEQNINNVNDFSKSELVNCLSKLCDRIKELEQQRYEIAGVSIINSERLDLLEKNAILKPEYLPEEVALKPYYKAEQGTFEWALCHMKLGSVVARSGWNAKNQAVFLSKKACDKDPLEDHFRIYTDQGKVNTWVPSVSDLLANDWNL